MSILSEEQLKKLKDTAHDNDLRQNIKSHCTKIREGIRKNGSTSGNRAIWELFQNAGDLSLSGSAEIRMTLTDDSFVFAHKGKPFTFDSLCSLVKQVSSQEKENDETVGQYGTGFLTTHKFGRKITVNGSICISESPAAYADIDGFVIDRENFDDIPSFIDDMFRQIKNVESLLDAEQKSEAREWTELCYELNENRKVIVQTAFDEAEKLMPYVLTFNDNIGSCTINDKTRNKTITFTKEDKKCSTNSLYCKRVKIIEDSGVSRDFDCYYLELHGGESRIILPLSSETEVVSFGDIPRLYVHFPLIGPNYFGVNFLFHSHKFTPEESRDNIIVPRDNDATDSAALANQYVLNEMTSTLWGYLEENIHTWTNTINMAAVYIKDKGYSESKTEAYYKELKANWVDEYSKLDMIQIGTNRYNMNQEGHPLMMDPSLEQFISNNNEIDYLSTIYPYAAETTIIPCKEELVQWSRIVAEWDCTKERNFFSLESVVEYVSKNQGEHLHDFLKMIVDSGHTEFFEKYALLPNREGMPMKRGELRDAKPITADLYELVKSIDSKICSKMVAKEYADIIELTPYSRTNLREELNSSVKRMEDEYWRNSQGQIPYCGDFEKSLIALCSSYTTINGDSKRNKLMPIICRFENIEYSEKHIPAWIDDPTGLDLYRQVFLSLIENQMMKIQSHDSDWVIAHKDDLVTFVETARGDDYKNFCTQYAIYPDKKGVLHTPDSLKKNHDVSSELFELYKQVLGEDLERKCVDSRFESFYDKYSEDTYQYSPQSVAKEIQNKLSADNYQDVVLLDIIDYTEKESAEGLQWRILFKDIYDQRESIRYKLGSDKERQAINRMLKRKKPDLIERMAEVSEREDADTVLDALNNAINEIQNDAYKKMLGAFVEEHIQIFLTEALSSDGIDVRNEQCGQDFILSKEGYDDYFIEVKSRWEEKASAIMSSTQFQNAVANPNRFSLISARMWNFDRTRAERNEKVELSEFNPLIKVCNKIGILENDLERRLSAAFVSNEDDIHAVGSYEVLVPQKVFDMDFNSLIDYLKAYFTKPIN